MSKLYQTNNQQGTTTYETEVHHFPGLYQTNNQQGTTTISGRTGPHTGLYQTNNQQGTTTPHHGPVGPG